MTPSTLDELLAAVGAPDGTADQPLELGSLAVLQIVDLIEATSGILLPSSAITRSTMATRASILTMLAEHAP